MWARIEYDFGFMEEASRLKEQALSTAKRIGHTGMREEISTYIGDLLKPPQAEADKNKKIVEPDIARDY